MRDYTKYLVKDSNFVNGLRIVTGTEELILNVKYN